MTLRSDMNPLVTCIIPTYDRAESVVLAVRSVIEQTYQNIEIIVVDDGSTDGTEAALSEFDGKIRYIYQKNSGVSAARNLGIKNSNGEFIALLDSDDLWLPKKVAAQMAYFKANPDVSVCQTEEIWIRNGKRVNPKNIHKKYSGWIFEKCIPLCIVSPSAVMIKKNVFNDIGLFDETLATCEDYDLWLRASLKYQITTLAEALIVKTGGHADQLSKTPLQDVNRIKALQKLLASGMLTDERRSLVLADISRRARIVEAGALKRRNDV